MLRRFFQRRQPSIPETTNLGTDIPALEISDAYGSNLTAEDKQAIEDIATSMRQSEEVYVVTLLEWL